MGRRDRSCVFEADGCSFIAVPDQDACERHGGVMPSRPQTGAPIDHMVRRCGATTRTGGVCAQPPRQGTNRCRMHGSSAPEAIAKGERVVAEAEIVEAAKKYGQPRSITAIDALVGELHRTQGHVDWLEGQLSVDNRNPVLLNVYQAERAHLAKLGQRMLAANVDERRAQVPARVMDAVEKAIAGVLAELGHDPSNPYLRDVVRRHLQAAATGQSVEEMPKEIEYAQVVPDIPRPIDF